MTLEINAREAASILAVNRDPVIMATVRAKMAIRGFDCMVCGAKAGDYCEPPQGRTTETLMQTHLDRTLPVSDDDLSREAFQYAVDKGAQ